MRCGFRRARPGGTTTARLPSHGDNLHQREYHPSVPVELVRQPLCPVRFASASRLVRTTYIGHGVGWRSHSRVSPSGTERWPVSCQHSSCGIALADCAFTERTLAVSNFGPRDSGSSAATITSAVLVKLAVRYSMPTSRDRHQSTLWRTRSYNIASSSGLAPMSNPSPTTEAGPSTEK